ncbi:fatty acid-binding protein, adipocyte-like [Engystomops pustulosus]
MCEEMCGMWKLTENNADDFNKYMEICGVSFLTRQAARHLRPDMDISVNNGEWCIKTMSTFKNTELKFKLGEEFEECTADGRKVQALLTFENGVLIHKQKWDGKESKITRELKDGRLVTTCSIDDASCVRVYDKK